MHGLGLRSIRAGTNRMLGVGAQASIPALMPPLSRILLSAGHACNALSLRISR